jgi:hypothetical protein
MPWAVSSWAMSVQAFVIDEPLGAPGVSRQVRREFPFRRVALQDVVRDPDLFRIKGGDAAGVARIDLDIADDVADPVPVSIPAALPSQVHKGGSNSGHRSQASGTCTQE